MTDYDFCSDDIRVSDGHDMWYAVLIDDEVLDWDVIDIDYPCKRSW